MWRPSGLQAGERVSSPSAVSLVTDVPSGRAAYASTAYPSRPANAIQLPSGAQDGSSAPPGRLVMILPTWRPVDPVALRGTRAICVGPGSLNSVMASCEPSGDQATESTASSCSPGVARTCRPLPSAPFISHSTGKVEDLSET